MMQLLLLLLLLGSMATHRRISCRAKKLAQASANCNEQQVATVLVATGRIAATPCE